LSPRAVRLRIQCVCQITARTSAWEGEMERVTEAVGSRIPRTMIGTSHGRVEVWKRTVYPWLMLYQVALLAALLIALQSTGYTQPAASSTSQVTDEPLAEQVNDPLAHLTQVQIKDFYTPAQYGTDAQPNTVQWRSVFAIQPFLLIPVEQLLRPTIRVTTVPKGKGASTITGFDDVQLLDLFEIPWPNSAETKFRWGIGPYTVFPTSSTKGIGKRAWQLGPAAGFAYRGVPGLNISGLLQQATSFAYTSPRSTPITSLTFQPLLSYQLGHGWYLQSSDATWTFNLRHNTSTLIPLSAGLGKVWELSDGYAIDTSISGEWTAYRQFSNQTEQFTLNFQAGLLFPKLEL
jgi:hypothetical protein